MKSYQTVKASLPSQLTERINKLAAEGYSVVEFAATEMSGWVLMEKTDEYAHIAEATKPTEGTRSSLCGCPDGHCIYPRSSICVGDKVSAFGKSDTNGYR